MGPAGLIAILAGWVTTEVGRQPWVVTGLLRTADAVSRTRRYAHEHQPAGVFYCLLLGFGVGYSYMVRLITHGPQAWQEESH